MLTLWIARRFGIVAALLGIVVASASAVAQVQEPATVAPPAHIAYLDGAVMLERDGTVETASVNAPVVPGDRLRTAAGRVDVLFPDGTTLDLDETSSTDMLSPTVVRLTSGRAMVFATGTSNPSPPVRYQIDTTAASARMDGPGEYRVAVFAGRDAPETELAVLRGLATLATDRGTVTVRAGERGVALDGGGPSLSQPFNSARLDAFDRWTADRRAERAIASSAQHLPSSLQMYGGTLDQYGSWQYAAPYGYVWYPSVAAGWRPYYYGFWSPIRSYGWTWVGTDVWSWPTHHYGRWGYGGGGWFWIPGRTWAPAWVSWAAAPGYVSWCPLGFDGRAVFALSIARGDPWVGWVVVPRTTFGNRDHVVHRYAIAPYELARTTPFIVQPTAPVALPRGAGRPPVITRRPGGNRDAGVGRLGTHDDPGPAAAGRSGPADLRPGPADPPSPRGFKQPLPDRLHGPVVDRPTPTAPPAAGQKGNDRPLTADRRPAAADRPRAPEVVGPRYRAPASERPGPGAAGARAGRRADPGPGSAPARGESRGAPRPDGRRQ
jgi:hypothetical protein